MIYDELHFSIYFGDARDALYPTQYRQWTAEDLMNDPSVQKITEGLSLDTLTFLAQVHGADGMLVTRGQTVSPFLIDGDFLITQDLHCGIGVMTADCLPVVCYDPKNHIVGIAHAGWRGAVAGVVDSMLFMMRRQCGTQIDDVQFFYGPSAQPCCYEVDEAFIQSIPQGTPVEHREGALYFDLPGFMMRKLAAFGVYASQINRSYASCTICNDCFCSHRRATKAGTPAREGRQMTVVALKDRGN